MRRIYLHIPAKIKDRSMQEAMDSYLKRLKSRVLFERVYHGKKAWEKSLLALFKPWVLDAKGRAFSSEGFSEHLMQGLEQRKGRLDIIIGEDTGLSQEIKAHGECISLSALTFTHQMVQLFLVEQIYRAFEIANKSPYHK